MRALFSPRRTLYTPRGAHHVSRVSRARNSMHKEIKRARAINVTSMPRASMSIQSPPLSLTLSLSLVGERNRASFATFSTRAKRHRSSLCPFLRPSSRRGRRAVAFNVDPSDFSRCPLLQSQSGIKTRLSRRERRRERGWAVRVRAGRGR